VVLIAATAFAADQTPVKKQFKDIAENDPLQPFFRYLTEKGIINGFPDGTFQPGANVTRAQAAKTVVLAKGLQPLKNTPQSFRDVNSKHWAFGEIEAAAQAGFFMGYPDGTFGPDKKISRAEAVSLFIRLAGGPLAGNDVTIKDVDHSNWAYRIIATAAQAGLVELDKDRFFHPDWPLRRDELARGITDVLTLGSETSQAQLIGTLEVKKGIVILFSADNIPHQITSSTKVTAGAKIVTGKDSEASLTYDDGSGILIEADTELTITKSQGRSYMRSDGFAGVAVDGLEISISKGRICGALASNYNKDGSAGKNETTIKDLPDRTLAGILLASAETLPDLRYSLFAANNNSTAQNQKAPWWLTPYTARHRVIVNMPWGVASVRGTFWMIEITTTKETISLIIGDTTVTVSQKTISITGDQYVVVSQDGTAPSQPAPLNGELKQRWAGVQEWVKDRAQEINTNAPPDMIPAIGMTITFTGQLPGNEDLFSIIMQALEEAISGIATSGGGSSGGGSSVTASPVITGIGAENTGGNPGLGNGDILTITFNVATNQPDVSTKALVDNLIHFGVKSFGANYSGVWSDAKTLVLTVTDSTGATLAVGDTLTLKATGNLKTANGLSSAGTSSHIIGGTFSESIVVHFNDTNLEAAIRSALGRPTGDITSTDMEGLTSLSASDKGIRSLTGLEYATSLETLYLNSNQIIDIGALAGLSKLQTLWLDNNQIADISDLAGLTNLQTLWLDNNQIADISDLAGLTNLQYLLIYDNQVVNISALTSLINLQALDLADNQIVDISALAGLTSLRFLNLNSNQFSDIRDLADLISIQYLGLGSNQITDISALVGLPNLVYLGLQNNLITTITALGNNSGLGSGDAILLNNNYLDITNSGSPAMDIINKLIGSGANVTYQPQN
jgi:hypothetical protein